MFKIFKIYLFLFKLNFHDFNFYNVIVSRIYWQAYIVSVWLYRALLVSTDNGVIFAWH
jgi:hypothetical protein